MKPNRRCNAGFTLIEMLLVVVIIGILAAIVVPNLMDRPNEANKKAAKGSMVSFCSALDAYAVDNGRYPSTDQGLEALIIKPTTSPEPKNWRGPYLRVVDLPTDPWGHPFRYLNPGEKRPPLYDLYCLGEDGVEGTDDDIRAF